MIRFRVLLPGAFLVSFAAAQNAPSTPAQKIPRVHETVEVTATRLPEDPAEVPAPIEVITGDELRARGVRDLRSALLLATGVEIAPGGDAGPASSVPDFWGLKEFDAFLLVVDGVPWGGTFNPALTTLDLNDLDRIEVLRGPAPVTYGATSFVGVIHVVHKAAAAETSYLNVRAGFFGSGGGSVDLALPAVGSWKSRLTADAARAGFRDDRTSLARGHANYRGVKSAANGKTWLWADFNWLTQSPASPHAREGAALSTATP